MCSWARHRSAIEEGEAAELKGLLLVYRDMRVEDQTALRYAMAESDELAVVWIYDESAEGVPWRKRAESHGLKARLAAFEFFKNALGAFGLTAHVIIGSYLPVLKEIQSVYPYEKIYLNTAHDRAGIQSRKAAVSTGVSVQVCDDLTVFKPEDILKKDGSSYQMFTPYYKKWIDQLKQTQLVDFGAPEICKVRPVHLNVNGTSFQTETTAMAGGFTAMNEKWVDFLGTGLEGYLENRDYPERSATSGMSIYLNTGMMSPRRMVSMLIRSPGHEAVLRQYVWREFYQQILAHRPCVLDTAMRPEFADVHWESNPDYFDAWAEGQTGVPIVDAAMRQLRHEGYMHNRLRMVVASYLVKDLHVNWQLGERYFFEMLSDAEPALNNGGWQWSASTGTDAQPYFRVFNPWQQSLRYDPDAVYMKRWLSDYRDASAAEFHRPGGLVPFGYPEVIVDHAAAVKMTKALYQSAKNSFTNKESTVNETRNP
jgi:deoxyribodipyrimidine photo-lyase